MGGLGRLLPLFVLSLVHLSAGCNAHPGAGSDEHEREGGEHERDGEHGARRRIQ